MIPELIFFNIDEITDNLCDRLSSSEAVVSVLDNREIMDYESFVLQHKLTQTCNHNIAFAPLRYGTFEVTSDLPFHVTSDKEAGKIYLFSGRGVGDYEDTRYEMIYMSLLPGLEVWSPQGDVVLPALNVRLMAQQELSLKPTYSRIDSVGEDMWEEKDHSHILPNEVFWEE